MEHRFEKKNVLTIYEYKTKTIKNHVVMIYVEMGRIKVSIKCDDEVEKTNE